MKPFPATPDFASCTADELAAFITENGGVIENVGADPKSYVSKDYTSKELLEDLEAAVEANEAARAALATLEAETTDEPEAEEEPVEEHEDEVDEDAFAALAARAAETAEVEEPEIEETPVVEAVAEPEPEPTTEVVAAAPSPPRRRSTAPPMPTVRPARSERATPGVTPNAKRVSLAASVAGLGAEYGQEIDLLTAASMMIKRRKSWGNSDGIHEEKHPIAQADWSDQYPDERSFRGMQHIEVGNELVAAALNPEIIKREMRMRREGKSLTASGGLCAPVTPYYGLMDISTAARPVRNGLPAFGADRGGLTFGRPASLAAITTAIGAITAEADAAGGTFATKTCQRIDCPNFEEVDVDTLYHCLEVGNLLARTYPELVAQWTSLTLSAHARMAESRLLTGIDQASTPVTAGDMGLGASAALLGQYLAAANGYRNRHRMDPDAVLRLMLPDWSIDLMISDVIRSQFQRFETDEAKLTALLRSFDLEPSFYIDSAQGRGQVFGPQAAGPLDTFPSTVVAYMFAEGSFLYLDGGTLELGLVRDSVLNQTNDYQLFGETFENVAFLGIESLAILSSTCDSGTVSAPVEVTCGS